MRLSSLIALPVFLFFGVSVQAQSSVNAKIWFQQDSSADLVDGISLEKAYQLLKGKKSTPTIVAVIDTGVDTTHEDLKKILWVNKKEIPGNGIDDDKNGYVDDIYGWNFQGKSFCRNSC